MRPEQRDTFHTVADVIVYEKQPANFEHGPTMPSTSDKIFVRDTIADIPIHVEAMNELVLESVTARHKRVDTRLLTN